MVYDISNITAAAGPMEFFQATNQLSNGIAGHGLLLVFFLIILSIAIAHTNNLGKSLLASGMASIMMGLLFVISQLSTWWLPIFFAVVVVVGIIMLQEKDYG